MIVHWQISDGYMGGSRPQRTRINDEDLEGLSEAEKEALIYEIVQEDFNQKVTFTITRKDT